MNARASFYGVRPIDARAATALARRYCLEHGLARHTPAETSMWVGFYDDVGLAGAVGYIDTPEHRYVTDWYSAPGRRGKTAASALVDRIRSSSLPIVGWVTPSNTAARRWLEANGGYETPVHDAEGNERVIAIYLGSAR